MEAIEFQQAGGRPLDIHNLEIGGLSARIPIVQGGMGIAISGASLAAAVANEGGIGIISGVQIGFREPDFARHPLAANIRALRREIRRARALSPQGIIGVNFMVAMTHYRELVRAAVEEKIDLIVSGAGLPLDLPAYTKGTATRLLPIVSSAKAAQIIIRRWARQDRLPDAIVLEGPLAGGHLGFSRKQLGSEETRLETLLADLLALLQKLHLSIPVIVAGGISSGREIARFLQAGASGVQLGTLFVATCECEAPAAFKQAYLDSRPEDVRIIDSPVGMPGRALFNRFLAQTQQGRIPVSGCFRCLDGCDPARTPYCISRALMESALGRDGLVFCGARAYLLERICPVRERIAELLREIRAYPPQQEAGTP